MPSSLVTGDAWLAEAPVLPYPGSCHVSPLRPPEAPPCSQPIAPFGQEAGPVQKLPDSNVSPGCQMSALANSPQGRKVEESVGMVESSTAEAEAEMGLACVYHPGDSL